MRTLHAAKGEDSLASRSYAARANHQQAKKRRKINSDAFEQDRLLTSTQVMAMYLARHRRKFKGSRWADYIATLPADFRSWHPLTWLVSAQDDEEDEAWKTRRKLAEQHLPASSKRRLDHVCRRFQRDLAACANLTGVEDPGDFLWGWLNVNTRTLYVNFGIPPVPTTARGSSPAHSAQEALHGEENNHTMAPILDFANHCHSLDPNACKVELAHAPDDITVLVDYQIKTPPGRTMASGEEVVFAYGLHSDDVLFADYGFVGEPDANSWNEVLLDEIIEREIWQTVDKSQADLKKQVLEMHDYLG